MMVEAERRPYVGLRDETASWRGWLVGCRWEELEDVGRCRNLIGVHLVEPESRGLKRGARRRAVV